MTIESLLSFSLAMLILAATPGPGVFASVAQALSSGFMSALFVIGGIIIGDIIFLMLAVFGLSAIAYVLGDLFFIIKIVGGAYLIWLGLRMWTQQTPTFNTNRIFDKRNGGQRFLGGLFITLGNPKVILFYGGFLPTFMDLTRLTPIDICMVAFIVTAVLGLVMGIYAFFASRARLLFSSPRAARNLNRGAGTVLIGSGMIIATR